MAVAGGWWLRRAAQTPDPTWGLVWLPVPLWRGGGENRRTSAPGVFTVLVATWKCDCVVGVA